MLLLPDTCCLSSTVAAASASSSSSLTSVPNAAITGRVACAIDSFISGELAAHASLGPRRAGISTPARASHSLLALKDLSVAQRELISPAQLKSPAQPGLKLCGLLIVPRPAAEDGLGVEADAIFLHYCPIELSRIGNVRQLFACSHCSLGPPANWEKNRSAHSLPSMLGHALVCKGLPALFKAKKCNRMPCSQPFQLWRTPGTLAKHQAVCGAVKPEPATPSYGPAILV